MLTEENEQRSAVEKEIVDTKHELEQRLLEMDANEAQKASRVDPTLKKDAAQSAASYRAKAPTKKEIFIEGKAGQTIKIGCWIQSSIKVPTIKK